MTVSFTSSRSTLAGLADRAGSVVPANSLRPELRNFLVEASADTGLSFTATDLGLTVFARAAGVSVPSPVSCQVPAARLTGLLKEAPEGDVTVTVHEPASDGIRLVKVAAGGSFWDLRVPVTPFPVVPDLSGADWHQVPREPLLAALKAVRHAAGRDGGNLAQACVTITAQGDGRAKVTAYDGARLQQATLAAFPFSTRIPALGRPAALDEMIRLLGINPDLTTVSVAQTDVWLAVRSGSATLVTQRLNVTGRDLEQAVIRPAMDNNQELSVDRAALRTAIRRVSVNSDAETSAIGLRLEKGRLTVVSEDKFHNAAEEPLSAQWAGRDRLVVVHHGFLSDMLAVSPAPVCRFWLAPESKGRKSLVLLRDDEAGVTGLIPQMPAKALGY